MIILFTWNGIFPSCDPFEAEDTLALPSQVSREAGVCCGEDSISVGGEAMGRGKPATTGYKW